MKPIACVNGKWSGILRLMNIRVDDTSLSLICDDIPVTIVFIMSYRLFCQHCIEFSSEAAAIYVLLDVCHIYYQSSEYLGGMDESGEESETIFIYWLPVPGTIPGKRILLTAFVAATVLLHWVLSHPITPTRKRARCRTHV